MLSELILDSESLNQALDGRQLPREELYEIFESSQNSPDELFKAARALRGRNKSGFVSFSKKAFFNLVNLCRDTCSYCTYKAEPGEQKLSLMSRQDVSETLDLARRYRCVEALFVTGESPEQRYPEARRWLRQNGFSSTVEYIAHCSEIALERGLFPHTNAGNLSREEMAELKKTNVSMGRMLENVSDRLARRGGPHFLAASKSPESRLKVLEDSGELGIPMTTGVLLGIGETAREVIDSLVAIRRAHQRHGNIQEVILQNFQPKPDTVMGGHPAADEGYFKAVVALTRVIMPEMNIQVPPNLSPGSYQGFIEAGINDWGGISPLTPDFVNPEFPWPDIKAVEQGCNDAGFELKCRFPVYPEFFPLVGGDLRDRLLAVADSGGHVREDYWR